MLDFIHSSERSELLPFAQLQGLNRTVHGSHTRAVSLLTPALSLTSTFALCSLFLKFSGSLFENSNSKFIKFSHVVPKINNYYDPGIFLRLFLPTEIFLKERIFFKPF